MKRFYIVTVVACLLIALFYWYGLSVDRYQNYRPPTAAETVDLPQ